MEIVKMMDDDRPIKSVCWAEGNCVVSVGTNRVESIVAYGEPGDNSYIPWLAIYRNGEIWMRICAGGKEIEYFPVAKATG